MIYKIEFEYLTYSDINETRLTRLVNDLDQVYIPPVSSLVDDIKIYTRKMIKNAIVVIAKYKEKDIGFIATYCNDKSKKKAYVTSLAVQKDFQSKKIGKNLLDIAIDDAIQNEMLIIELEVQNANVAAIKFYEKCGFNKTMTTNNKSIVMQKVL